MTVLLPLLPLLPPKRKPVRVRVQESLSLGGNSGNDGNRANPRETWTMNTYDVMDKIGQAQAVLDCAVVALGDNRIPECNADVQGALGAASRMLREAHEDLDRLTHPQHAGQVQP